MSFVAVAIGAGAVIAAGGAIAGGVIQSRSIDDAQTRQLAFDQRALDAQTAAGQQARQDQMPFAQAGMGGVAGLGQFQDAGTDALAQQRALAGLDGPEAQQAAIQMLQNGPQFQSMLDAGNNNILQNASATGGLRGGNTQAALGMLAPSILDQLISQQFSRLGGLAGAGQGAASNIAGLGQGAAAGQAAQGVQTGQLQGNVLGQMGASAAGAALAQGQAASGAVQGTAKAVSGGLGTFAGGF